MRRAVILAFASLLLGGCVDAGDVARALRFEPQGPTDRSQEVEPSMAPDFSGSGPSYPVLLVHQHHVPSQRQREEAERNPVVCLALDGRPIEFAATSERTTMMEMAACAGPPADPPTGRLYANRTTFEKDRPLGVGVLMSECSGGITMLSAGDRDFEVSTREHTFLVELLPNGTFSVDGRWVRPGTALKVSYYISRGDANDEEFVRVVFDAPGQWLVSRVGEMGRNDDPDVPPRPLQGSGLVVEVPVAPATLGAALAAVLAATPGSVSGVSGLRAVHHGERLTEFTLRVVTDRGVVTWYGAGRIGDAMRLLGAQEPAVEESFVTAEGLLTMSELEWAALRAGVAGDITDVRLAPDVAWTTVGPVALGVPRERDTRGCDGGCVFVRGGDGWFRLLVAQRGSAAGALTLRVLADGDAGPTEVWWHTAS